MSQTEADWNREQATNIRQIGWGEEEEGEGTMQRRQDFG